MFSELLGYVALKKTMLLMALAGALLSLRFSAAIVTWWGRALVVAQGFGVSIAATPFVAERLGASFASEQFIAAALALFGISVVDAVMRAIRETNLADVVAGWLKKPGA